MTGFVLDMGKQEREAVLGDFFQQVADAFYSGDHVWLSGIYIYPLVVYVEGEIFLERTPEETLAALFERREVALRAGTHTIEAQLLEIGSDDAGRFPVRVDWMFLDADGRVVTRNRLRYFCRFDGEGHPRIEILEFIERGLPSAPVAATTTKH